MSTEPKTSQISTVVIPNSPPSYELATASAAALSKATIEAKFTVALHRPRNILAVRDKLLEACRRPLFAEAAWYSKPVGGGSVRGPSIRFAETAIQCMTNITSVENVVYEDDQKLVLHIEVIDLETNTSYGSDVRITKTVERKNAKDRVVISQRLNSGNETVYTVFATDDELANKVNAAKSKVIRNSGLRLVPQDIIDEADAICRETIKKGGGDPQTAVKRIADAFSGIGIKPAALEKYLGHTLAASSPAEIGTLREMFAAIRDGESKWADYQKEKKAEVEAPKFAKDEAKPAEPTASFDLDASPPSAHERLRLAMSRDNIGEDQLMAALVRESVIESETGFVADLDDAVCGEAVKQWGHLFPKGGKK